MVDRALTKEQAAAILNHSPRTLADPRWRQRVGLMAVRIGRSIRFRERDLLRLLEQGAETFPEASVNESD